MGITTMENNQCTTHGFSPHVFPKVPFARPKGPVGSIRDFI
jgi:hypothetical protein